MINYGVVWHTGNVLASGAVGPRFKPRQGQGQILLGLFCSVSGWHINLQNLFSFFIRKTPGEIPISKVLATKSNRHFQADRPYFITSL